MTFLASTDLRIYVDISAAAREGEGREREALVNLTASSMFDVRQEVLSRSSEGISTEERGFTPSGDRSGYCR